MKVFAALVVAFAVMLSAPTADAVDLPKLEGVMSLVDNAKTKKGIQIEARAMCDDLRQRRLGLQP